MHPRDLITDVVDLVLGRGCLDCGRPGRVLCDSCLARLRGQCTEREAEPGLPPVSAALPYEDDGRRLVLAYKEEGMRALAPMLGVLLGDAVRMHLDGSAGSCLLVPVPGHRRARRGFDALGDVARWVRRDLACTGIDARLVRPLRTAAAYRPLKGLTRDERQHAITGAFGIDRSGRLSLGRTVDPVIVIDDVVTTGATVREAIHTLYEGGIPVAGVAAIAIASRDTPAPTRARARPTPRP